MSTELATLPQLQLSATVHVESLYRAKEQLKDVKNALKAYKPASEELSKAKAQKKIINAAFKEEKERLENEFQKDPAYTKLREEKLDAEEKIANAKLELKNLLKEASKKNERLDFTVDIQGRKFIIQTQLALDLYLDGKKE